MLFSVVCTWFSEWLCVYVLHMYVVCRRIIFEKLEYVVD